MNTLGNFILAATATIALLLTAFNAYLLSINPNWTESYFAGAECGMLFFALLPIGIALLMKKFDKKHQRKLRQIDEHELMTDGQKLLKARNNK